MGAHRFDVISGVSKLMSNLRFKIPTYWLTGAVSVNVLLLTVAFLQGRSVQAEPLASLAPPQARNLMIAQDPQGLARQAAQSLGTPLPPGQAVESTAIATRPTTASEPPQFPVPRSYTSEAALIQTLANTSQATAVAGITNSDVGFNLRSAAPTGAPNPGTALPKAPIFSPPPANLGWQVPARPATGAALSPLSSPAPAPTMTSAQEAAPLQTALPQPTQSPFRLADAVPTVRTINPTPMSTAATMNGLSPLDAPLTLPSQKNSLLTQSGSGNADALTAPGRPLLRSTALSSPKFTLQGVYLYQGDQTSARARLTIAYPLTPRVLFGTSLDLATGNAFSDTRQEGFSVNELYIATSLADIPNLRFVIGQIDFTSYFDRNSFAKDGATHFFNSAFQTNPALSAAGLSSRPGLLLNWALTDNIEAKAATFSSSRGLSDFSLDGFAGELGIRYGNAIIRGTYVTDRASGNSNPFNEIGQIARGNNQFGVLKGDREESYGINAEVFIPNLKMGIFGRYGRYNNRDLGSGGDTFSGGITFLDLFTRDDRLGLGYGRGLSNDNLRRSLGERTPDVLEAFYDFRFLPNLRVGFSVQERNNFSEVVAGIRVKTEFDVTPKGRLAR